MEMGDKISVLRKKANLTLEDVGNAVGVGKSTVKKWESGAIKNMRRDKIASLAAVLHTTPAYLMGWKEETAKPLPSNVTPISKGSRVPLYGRIACGPPILAVEDLEETAWLPDGVKADFALTACGDSMINARIFDGDIVYIRDTEVHNGDIAAVIVRDEEVTLKRFYYYPDEDRMVLRAENPTVKAQEYVGEELNHVRVLGKAVNFLSTVR